MERQWAKDGGSCHEVRERISCCLLLLFADHKTEKSHLTILEKTSHIESNKRWYNRNVLQFKSK